jgi:glyoxylase-like metal-dependent hydrolase (beta-lactamase superfamily II)/rhodanese-related sulfurtransferase
VVFRQFVDDDLGCGSYLIGDERTAEAVVVDPAYAIEQYVDEAERRGLRLTRVLETHTHADHLSGHGRLALERGLPVAIHPAAEPEYPFELLEDGAELVFGGVQIRVLHTPGHRPEHCCFLVNEQMLLTGDSLLVGDAARPDLAVEAKEGAEEMFHSLRRLVDLSDETKVYPGHVAGSLCATGISEDRSSTIGHERRTNRALAFDDLKEFITATSSISAPRPPNSERIVELNKGAFVGAQPPLAELESFTGTLLDVRRAEAFAAGHMHGSLNVPVSGSSFGTKAAFVLEETERFAITGSSREEAEEAARRLHAVGVFGTAGYLPHAGADERLDPVDLDELERLLEADEVEVLDVRELSERDEGYIAGSRNIPYRVVRAFVDELADGRPVVTICSSGARAAIAASVLAASGVDARPVLGAGIDDWEARGHHTVAFRRCGG